MACLKKKTGRELVFNQDVELIQSQFCRVLDGLWDAVCSVFSPLPPPFRWHTEELGNFCSQIIQASTRSFRS